MSEELFELEWTDDRDALAPVVAEVATALEEGRPARVTAGDETVSVAFPPRLSLSVEVERDAGPAATGVELELDLEWDEDPSEPTVSVGEAGRDRDRDRSATGADGRRSRFEVYRDRVGEWRWRLVHWNGNVVADGGEGYASRSNAERAVRGVQRIATEAHLERLDD